LILISFHSYGPQGEFVMYSSLLRLISELERDQEKLEQELFSTLHTVITEGNNHEQFDYDELASSNYLSLDDFIRFFLVHAVATSMILQGFDDPHDTLFKKSNSNEYGELFLPEDITEPCIHTIHYQHTLAIKFAQADRDTELDSTPPCHRKSVHVKTEAKHRL
jgi:hypothetical protein